MQNSNHRVWTASDRQIYHLLALGPLARPKNTWLFTLHRMDTWQRSLLPMESPPLPASCAYTTTPRPVANALEQEAPTVMGLDAWALARRVPAPTALGTRCSCLSCHTCSSCGTGSYLGLCSSGGQMAFILICVLITNNVAIF